MEEEEDYPTMTKPMTSIEEEAPTEEEGLENHRSGPGVNVPAVGDADGDVVSGEGAIAAWSRGTKLQKSIPRARR